jgi:hypothetical protein
LAIQKILGSGMKNETSITKSFSSIDEQYTITQCSNGYILEINGRDKKDDYLSIKHLVLKHEELVDVLIEVDQAIRSQRSAI